MADQKERSVGSKILRDRAMAVLRATRSKMDPVFLERMKAHLTPFAQGTLPSQPAHQITETSLETKAQSFAALLKEMREAPEKEEVKTKPTASMPSKTEDESEPVDKQKIALIVMNYMKNKQKH